MPERHVLSMIETCVPTCVVN